MCVAKYVNWPSCMTFIYMLCLMKVRQKPVLACWYKLFQWLTFLSLDQLGCVWHCISGQRFRARGRARSVGQSVRVLGVRRAHAEAERPPRFCGSPPAGSQGLRLRWSVCRHTPPCSTQGQRPLLFLCSVAFQQSLPLKCSKHGKHSTAESSGETCGQPPPVLLS